MRSRELSPSSLTVPICRLGARHSWALDIGLTASHLPLAKSSEGQLGHQNFPGTVPASSSDTVSLFAQLKLVKLGREKLAANPGGLCAPPEHPPNTDFHVTLNLVSSELTDVAVIREG